MDNNEFNMPNEENTAFEQKPSITYEKNNNYALVSMICGIASLLLGCCTILSLPCGVAAVIFGIISLKSNSRTMAIAGIVLGGVSVIFAVITLIALFIVFLAGAGNITESIIYPSIYTW